MRKVLLTMIILLTSYATIYAQGIEIAFALPVGNCQLSDNTAKMLSIIRKTKCYRFTKRNVPKHKTKRLRYRCPPEPYSNSVRTDFFSYSNAIILESQQINTSI